MTNNDKQLDMPKTAESKVLAWEALEFAARDKSWQWITWVWLAGIGLAALALWSYKISFLGIIAALAAISAALALTTQGRIKPKNMRASIDERGVSAQGQLYAWDELKGFWIVFTSQNQALYLETTRRILPIVIIALGKTDPELVRTTLLAHLPEHADRAEEFSDRLARIMRF